MKEGALPIAAGYERVKAENGLLLSVKKQEVYL